MKKILVGVFAALAIVITGIAVNHSSSVSAQSVTSTEVNANNMRLSPLRTDITVEAGKAGAVTVYIQNMSEDTVTLRPIANDFQAGDEQGTPSLLLNEGEFAKSHSLKKFMSIPKSITVKPKERAAVSVRIDVPAKTLAGGYFGAIRFVPVDEAGNAQVNLTGSVASLILLKVPGDLVEKLSLVTFDVRQDGKTGLFFSQPKNLDVLLRFKNEGNVQVTPFGKVLVSKSGNVVYSAEINNAQPAGQALPDSVRRWSIPLSKIGNFGKYTVTASVGYGDHGKTITQERTIWIIPMILIIGVLSGLVVIVFLIIVLPKLIRAYNQKVIRNSRGGRKR